MITKMKKLSFLIHSKEYDQFLEQLRSLGVVHVIQKQQGAVQNEELQDDLNLLGRCKNAIKAMSDFDVSETLFTALQTTVYLPSFGYVKALPCSGMPSPSKS